jgi:tetratricopeptide (TPR) repeat protein
MLSRLLIALSMLALVPAAMADLASAQRLYDEGRAADALTEVDSLLAMNPDDPELRFLEGVIYADQGKNDAAIEIFAALTRDYPQLPEPYNNLAVLFAEKGEFDKARESLLAAIQAHPGYSTAHENLGDLYAKMAAIAYDRALEEDRTNESARLKLSAVNALFSKPQGKPDASSNAAVSTAGPVPAAPTTATEHAPAQAAMSQTSAVEAAVETWRTAWVARDADGYVNAYSSDYAPTGMTHEAWTAQRREQLAELSHVNVAVDNLQVAFPAADTAEAEFTQAYQADDYEDRVRKTLTLSRTDSGWRIVQETARPR